MWGLNWYHHSVSGGYKDIKNKKKKKLNITNLTIREIQTKMAVESSSHHTQTTQKQQGGHYVQLVNTYSTTQKSVTEKNTKKETLYRVYLIFVRGWVFCWRL